MAKRVSAGWPVRSAGDHPRPALLGLNDTLLGVLSWLGSRDVARLRRVCRELRDCGESAAQAAVARRGEAFGPDSPEGRAFRDRFPAPPNVTGRNSRTTTKATTISLPDEPWLRIPPVSRQPWLEVLRDLEAHERPLTVTSCDSQYVIVSGCQSTVCARGCASTQSCLFGAPMQRGVHFADFHIQRVNDGSLGPYPRVGVVQAGFDVCSDLPASDTEMGCGWACDRVVWVNCVVDTWLDDAYEWAEGDTLGLRLDVDRGTLMGCKNGGPMTVLSQGLLERAARQNVPARFVWCVEVHAESNVHGVAGTCVVRVERGAAAGCSNSARQ
eukprot:COSAG01_NODE_700_length_14174_cov_7.107069_2_plen_327_part_00